MRFRIFLLLLAVLIAFGGASPPLPWPADALTGTLEDLVRYSGSFRNSEGATSEAAGRVEAHPPPQSISSNDAAAESSSSNRVPNNASDGTNAGGTASPPLTVESLLRHLISFNNVARALDDLRPQRYVNNVLIFTHPRCFRITMTERPTLFSSRLQHLFAATTEERALYRANYVRNLLYYPVSRLPLPFEPVWVEARHDEPTDISLALGQSNAFALRSRSESMGALAIYIVNGFRISARLLEPWEVLTSVSARDLPQGASVYHVVALPVATAESGQSRIKIELGYLATPWSHTFASVYDTA